MKPALVLAVVLLLTLLVTAGPAAAVTVCDGSTALTLLGIDTSTGHTLISVPATGSSGSSAWIVELDGAGTEARAYPDDPKGRFGGSVGPGAVIAALPCGPSCLQPVRWKGGSWEPLGESVTSPTAATVAATWDHSGGAWLLLYAPSGADGQLKTWAYRLEGREWQPRGSMVVTAVGEPQALPAPQRKDGILTGTGLFSGSGLPEAWVAGLPSLPAARRGQLIALNGLSAAYVSGDGVVYLTDDSGKKWRRSIWTPWTTGTKDAVGIWRQGKDYWVDLPYGDHRASLRLAWFDQRRPSDQTVVLTRLGSGGDWQRLTDLPAEVKSKSDEHLPVTQVLVPQGDTWLLLSGCAATAQGSGLVLRSFDGKTVSAAKFLPLKTP